MEKFSIVVLPKSPASRAVAALQPIVRKQFWEQINRFSADPVQLSETARHDTPSLGQHFRFTVPLDDSVYYFTVIFRFADSRDENTILIADILVHFR
ncbi:MAG TPA: hypothetical protein VH253_03490 [Phycisphaerae bacterium]|nr:hypothetical protein [Phycisphaerae bacterium]